MISTLLTKYRPKTFEEVIGNSLSIKALQLAISSSVRPHTFLFTGPSGVGKTTLARIVANEVGATTEEIDAASNNGVEAIRGLVELAYFQPITGPSKMIIIDEAHTLTKTAWQPLLKICEEPPSHLYIAFATTESSKVLDTIKTRCYQVDLKLVKVSEIEDLITVVSELEGWTLANDVFQGIVLAATGQPRKALTILQSGHAARNRDELSEIVAQVEKENSALTELCRFLLTGGNNWGKISALLLKIENDDEIHNQACRYLTNSMLNSTEDGARRAWIILDALTFPRTSWDKKAQLSAAIGSLLWQK